MSTAAMLTGVLPFAVAMSITPGPNNLMLAGAGARFGYLRTWPHQLGVVIGFAVMMLGVGLGIAALIASAPGLYTAMKIASIVFILYLAWQTGRASVEMAPPEAGDLPGARPMSFAAAAGFQWINPKAWIITVTAMTTYTTPGRDRFLQIVLLTLVFAVVGAVSSSAWVIAGQMIRRYLTSPRRRTIFNWTMALLLAASIVPALFER